MSTTESGNQENLKISSNLRPTVPKTSEIFKVLNSQLEKNLKGRNLCSIRIMDLAAQPDPRFTELSLLRKPVSTMYFKLPNVSVFKCFAIVPKTSLINTQI